MFFSAALVALVAPLLASAAPIPFPRAASGTDALVFQFAGVLEQLETQFYQQALQKFQASDYTNAGFANGQLPIQLITSIQTDEATHLGFLNSALPAVGSAAITGCNFDFTSALSDVNTFAATARVVENVGVAAYLGGAALLDDPQLVDAAATILTVEARHQTVLNILSKTGTSIPQAFDIPLTPNEVLALAGPFIQGCSLPGLTANPVLTVTNTNVQPGTQLNFQSAALNSSVDQSKFSCQIMTGGIPFADVLPMSQCVVPAGTNGPVAIWITSDSQPLQNNVLTRATSQLVAGPAMLFVDAQPEMIGMLIATGGSSSSSGSSSGSSSSGSSNSGTGTGTGTAGASITTTTITPDQAQAIIASASASAAGASATGSSSSGSTGGVFTLAGTINPVTTVSADSLASMPLTVPSGQSANNAAAGPAPGSDASSLASDSTSTSTSSSVAPSASS